MARVDYEDGPVLEYLNRLSNRLEDMTPVLADIGEYEAEATKCIFETSIGPDGERWAPNMEATILQLPWHLQEGRHDLRQRGAGARMPRSH